jgi:hypothetical protein
MVHKQALLLTVDAPVGVLVDRLRGYLTQDRFFTRREEEFLFRGDVSEESFTLSPVRVDASFRSVQWLPVQITGVFEPSGGTTTVRATVRGTGTMFYAGAFAIGILAVLTYAVVVAPELLVAWLLLFVPVLLFSIGALWLYSWSRVRTAKRVVQNALLGKRDLLA